MITFCLFLVSSFLFLIYFHEFVVVCLFFKGRVLAARITYLFIYNSCGFPAHALLLQLLIPQFSVRVLPLFLSCVHPWDRRVSVGCLMEVWGGCFSPAVCVHSSGCCSFLATCRSQFADEFGFSPRVSCLGLGRGVLARAVHAVQSVPVTKCVAGRFC